MECESCSFLDSASACFTQACICSALSAAGNETVQACESCIRPFDSLVADSLVAVVDQCAILNMTTTPTPTSPPPSDCNQPCSAITQAFSTCSTNFVSCFCSPVFASGVECGQCLASISATRTASIISIDIPSCFRLANPEPISTANILGDCFYDNSPAQGPCYPLINATVLPPGATTRCVQGACLCPGALSAGTACLECIATLNPTVASDFANIGEIITSCQESPNATRALYMTYGTGGSGILPTETNSTTATAAPSAVFRSAAVLSGPGDILFKGMLYLGLFLLIVVFII